MYSYQLELFPLYTTAEERQDAHTSAVAMMRDFVEKMDLKNIALMMSDVYHLDGWPKDYFFSRLALIFMQVRMGCNDFLASEECVCRVCHPGMSCFVFRGEMVPQYFGLAFRVEKDRVVDIQECVRIQQQLPYLPKEFELRLNQPDEDQPIEENDPGPGRCPF
jgi:hypothetical protein